MYCMMCGKEQARFSRECIECGAKLDHVTAAAIDRQTAVQREGLALGAEALCCIADMLWMVDSSTPNPKELFDKVAQYRAGGRNETSYD